MNNLLTFLSFITLLLGGIYIVFKYINKSSEVLDALSSSIKLSAIFSLIPGGYALFMVFPNILMAWLGYSSVYITPLFSSSTAIIFMLIQAAGNALNGLILIFTLLLEKILKKKFSGYFYCIWFLISFILIVIPRLIIISGV